MGASWDVFYSFLERVLGTKNGSGNGGDKSGDGVVNKSNNDSNNNNNNNNNEEKTTDAQPPTDTLSVPLLLDTLPLLEKSKPITLASFYSLVTHAYYRIEPFVHRVNFEFTEQQRKVIDKTPQSNLPLLSISKSNPML